MAKNVAAPEHEAGDEESAAKPTSRPQTMLEEAMPLGAPIVGYGEGAERAAWARARSVVSRAVAK